MAMVAERWPEYLIERARRAPSHGCGIVPGTTSVVSFGDPVRPVVATLGINPSSGEFLGRGGKLLTGSKRRLASLDSLGVADHADIDAEVACLIVDDCARYFERRPYRWFGPLDRVLRDGAGVSYFDGTACHLDLVQWATWPLWGRLDEPARRRLLGEDEPFLLEQLRQEHYRLVVVNGRTVMRWVQRAGLARWRRVGELAGPPRAELYVSDGDGPLLLGWSCNLQSQAGAAQHSPALAAWVAQQAEWRTVRSSTVDHDVLPKGAQLDSVAELAVRLSTWFAGTTAKRLGAEERYGATPWLRVQSPLGRFVLNADTRRDAVESFVHVARQGRGLRMNVSPNRQGRVNKVTFQGCQEEGWYAYLERPLDRASSTDIDDIGVDWQPGVERRPRRRHTRGGSGNDGKAQGPPAAVTRGVATVDQASIVQFPHPGGEAIPQSDAMAWNTSRHHRRKFILAPGRTVTPDSNVDFEGEVVFWGEWEPPSKIQRRWPPRAGLPTVVHMPCWGDPPPGQRQNTDPWVFGSAFLYSNCKQLNPSGTPSALQRLEPGSLILFGSVRGGDYLLDTVFVVGRSLGRYRPGDRIAGMSRAFNTCTVDSLVNEPAHVSEASFNLLAGATRHAPVNGMFSFVPCRRRLGDESRFARPSIQLPGIINPRSRQAPSGAKNLRPVEQVTAAWNAIVDRVLAAELELGVELAEPSRCRRPLAR